MRFTVLRPIEAVALDAATTGTFFEVLASMLDDDLEVHVHVERRPPVYVLLLLALRGDMIVVEHELLIDWAAIEERHRLRLLRLYLDGVMAGHQQWRRMANLGLRRLGVAEIPPPSR